MKNIRKYKTQDIVNCSGFNAAVHWKINSEQSPITQLTRIEIFSGIQKRKYNKWSSF